MSSAMAGMTMMASSTMSMMMPSASSTSTASMSTDGMDHSMGGMDHDMGDMGEMKCKSMSLPDMANDALTLPGVH